MPRSHFSVFGVTSFNAHFDGERLYPDHPVTLPTGVRLRVTVADGVTDEVDEQTEMSPPIASTPTIIDSIKHAPSPRSSPFGWLAQVEEELGLVDVPAVGRP